MSDIVFGILVIDTDSFTTTDLAEELEEAANGEDWAWVLWELNHAYFGIIKGSLRLKGRASQIDGLDVISLGEAVDESEDSRAKWLVPAKSSTGSVHELAQRKILNFVALAYGENGKEEVEVPFVKPTERVLAPISTRKKFSGDVPGLSKGFAAPKHSGSESDEPYKAPPAPVTEGAIARKSRRGN